MPSAIIERAGDCIQRKRKGATGTVDFDPGGRSHIAAALRAWTWPTNEADVLSLGLDAASSIKARDSIEQMLMHQAAAAHKLAMRFMTKADHQLSQVDTWNSKAWSAHSVEAARLAHAAGKLLGAFNDSVLTVQRRRSGGKQVVQVIHQQVAVGAGGKAIVAGTVKGPRKTGGKLRGPK